MEISSEILESLVMDNKDVMEVLKEENITEDIIFESEVTEDSEEAEIEEIIEIIEEVEECDETTPSDDASSGKDKSKIAKDSEFVEKAEKKEQESKKNIELYGSDEENSEFSTQSVKQPTKSNNTQKITKKQVINYDVDEDWQDEELERMDELDKNSEITNNCGSSSQNQAIKRHINNQTVSLQSNKSDLSIGHVDPIGRSNKSRIDSSVGNNVNNIEDNETPHEIVKNVENNLLYTVLGTKKQDNSAKQQERLNDGNYVRVSKIL